VTPPINAPTELAGQEIALTNLPPARRAIVTTLKKRGEATVDDLAGAAGVTASAVRQHLQPLTADGLVAHREERTGPGRPRHWYRLTGAAESLFPKRYVELTNQLLGFVADTDAGLVDLAFEGRRRARTERALARLGTRSLDDRVRELATILDEDGYLADCERRPDGTWIVTEHNCAVIDVARRYGQACTSELAFLKDALPDTDVERISHMIAGAHVCAYQISPKAARTLRREGRSP
jgi:DeoR family suf operon transcriptional repressor